MNNCKTPSTCALNGCDCPAPKLPAWQDVLGEAEQLVRGKPIFTKYIKGTILENDVPVWIADFAQRALMRERARVAAQKSCKGASRVTHCPWCAAPVSVADEPYCANADCRWNNGGTAPAGVNVSDEPSHTQHVIEELAMLRRGVERLPKSPGKDECLKHLAYVESAVARGVAAPGPHTKSTHTPMENDE